MLVKFEGKRRRGQQWISWSDGIIDSMDMNLSKLWEIVKDGEPGVLQSMGSQRTGHELATEQQQILLKKKKRKILYSCLFKSCSVKTMTGTLHPISPNTEHVFATEREEGFGISTAHLAVSCPSRPVEFEAGFPGWRAMSPLPYCRRHRRWRLPSKQGRELPRLDTAALDPDVCPAQVQPGSCKQHSQRRLPLI